MAVKDGSPATVRVLLENFASRNIPDNMEQSPLDIAKKLHARQDIIKLLENMTLGTAATPVTPSIPASMLAQYRQPSQNFAAHANAHNTHAHRHPMHQSHSISQRPVPMHQRAAFQRSLSANVAASPGPMMMRDVPGAPMPGAVSSPANQHFKPRILPRQHSLQTTDQYPAQQPQAVNRPVSTSPQMCATLSMHYLKQQQHGHQRQASLDSSTLHQSVPQTGMLSPRDAHYLKRGTVSSAVPDHPIKAASPPNLYTQTLQHNAVMANRSSASGLSPGSGYTHNTASSPASSNGVSSPRSRSSSSGLSQLSPQQQKSAQELAHLRHMQQQQYLQRQKLAQQQKEQMLAQQQQPPQLDQSMLQAQADSIAASQFGAIPEMALNGITDTGTLLSEIHSAHQLPSGTGSPLTSEGSQPLSHAGSESTSSGLGGDFDFGGMLQSHNFLSAYQPMPPLTDFDSRMTVNDLISSSENIADACTANADLLPSYPGELPGSVNNTDFSSSTERTSASQLTSSDSGACSDPSHASSGCSHPSPHSNATWRSFSPQTTFSDGCSSLSPPQSEEGIRSQWATQETSLTMANLTPSSCSTQSNRSPLAGHDVKLSHSPSTVPATI